MNIKPIFLSPTADILEPKLTKKFTSLSKLIFAAGKHSLPDSLVVELNKQIDEISVFPGTTSETVKKLNSVEKELLKKLEKDHQLVPKNHFRNLWMVVGMSAFGLPLGAALGVMMDNMALLAVGLPFGLGIGAALGTSLDRKVKKEGRQLDFMVK
jgi:hypothetical protein